MVELECSAADLQPVVRLNRNTGERELVLMRWGLIPFWAKDPSMVTSYEEFVAYVQQHGVPSRACQSILSAGHATAHAILLNLDFFLFFATEEPVGICHGLAA
jgi:hypothetical protein